MPSHIVDTYGSVEPQCPLCKLTLRRGKEAVASSKKDQDDRSEATIQLGEVVLEQQRRI